MGIHYFSRAVGGWQAGGAFPAPGLIGIERTYDGGAESDGLFYFVGQELRIERVAAKREPIRSSSPRGWSTISSPTARSSSASCSTARRTSRCWPSHLPTAPRCGYGAMARLSASAARGARLRTAARERVAFRAANAPSAPGYNPGLQRHRLLPRQLLGQRCFGPLFDALGRDRVGFDDFRSNGLLLPARKSSAVRLGLRLHRGPLAPTTAWSSNASARLSAPGQVRATGRPK